MNPTLAPFVLILVASLFVDCLFWLFSSFLQTLQGILLLNIVISILLDGFQVRSFVWARYCCLCLLKLNPIDILADSARRLVVVVVIDYNRRSNLFYVHSFCLPPVRGA